MKCISPCYLSDLNFNVPCGRCIACRVNKTAEWSMRCVHEAQYHQSSVFITLTYDDESNPVSLSKRHITLFIKRFRKSLDRKIKYFLCGEYGDEYFRPHYHAILFNVKISDFNAEKVFGKLLYKHDSWPYGFIHLGTMSRLSARYVSKYIFKKYDNNVAEEEYCGMTVPFQRVSNGIGKQFVLDNYDKLRKDMYVYFNNKKCPLPRYYRKILNLTDVEYFTIIKELMSKNKSMFNTDSELVVDYEIQRRALQAVKDFQGYQKLFGKSSNF